LKQKQGNSTATPLLPDEMSSKCGSGGATIRLARECGVSVNLFVTETPLSRASPLPHLIGFSFQDQVGYQAAVLCF
jgi:hypothetical protein